MAGNPGAPFRFVIELTQTGPTTMGATLSQDAPLPMAADLTARHTAVSPNSVSIAKASKDGGIFTMTPDRDNATEVTVGVTSPRFTSGDHSGLQAAAGDTLEPEFPQIVSVTVNSLNAVEGETVEIRVGVDRADDEDTTIRYAIGPDTNPDTPDASAEDYADPGNGQVTIPSGETGASISITIISDQEYSEPWRETLLVSLLEPAPGQADDYWLATAVDITLIIRTGICDRTPAVYEAVVDRLRNINTGPLPPVSQCSDVVPEHLPLVTGGLDLYNQNITTFRDHDFEGLSGVRVLTLDYNPITTLQDGLLDGLTDLRKIYMSNTQISAVTTDTFALNTQLSELWLYSSRLTDIEDGAFSNLSNLRKLNLYDNNTGSFTAAKFKGLESLHRLVLSNNRLRAVPADLLSNTPELRTLGLQVNRLRDLPDDFFAGMRHLTEVNLMENKVTVQS